MSVIDAMLALYAAQYSAIRYFLARHAAAGVSRALFAADVSHFSSYAAVFHVMLMPYCRHTLCLRHYAVYAFRCDIIIF